MGGGIDSRLGTLECKALECKVPTPSAVSIFTSGSKVVGLADFIGKSQIQVIRQYKVEDVVQNEGVREVTLQLGRIEIVEVGQGLLTVKMRATVRAEKAAAVN